MYENLRELPPGDGFWRRTVHLVDVESRRVTPLAEAELVVPGGRVHGSVITNQAWAPDGRIVYMNAKGHLIVLDTASGREEDLGIGREPTWSPDGRFIAMKLPKDYDRRARERGDYSVFPVDRPGDRRLVLRNRRAFWNALVDWSEDSFYGPAIWTPDGRFLIVRRLRSELSYPYVFDLTSGEVAALPRSFRGYSWGGTP